MLRRACRWELLGRAVNMTAPTDVEVLQYALTLENLEAVF